MASLQKRKVKGNTYWYIVESKRIKGKPRPVVLAYLGKAETILKKLKEKELKKKLKSYSHGAVLSLWKIGKEFEIPGILHKYFPGQKRDGIYVSQTLFLAALHRALEPASKRTFAKWSEQTTLPELAKFAPHRLTSQHFWDQMNVVTEEMIKKVEEELTLKLIEKGRISLDTLFYDTTNFFTFIDSQNIGCKIAQRGYNKQKRNDLRQFGLALLMSRDFFLPISSEIYEGNKPDSKYFPEYLTKIRQRLEKLKIQLEDITLVFDKGNNSKKAFEELDESKLHFVGSLSSVYYKDLLEIEPSEFYEIKINNKRIKCCRTSKRLWGKDRTVVIYLSEKLREGQLYNFNQSLMRKLKRLQELKDKLSLPGSRKRKRKQLENQVKKIIAGEWGDFVIGVTIKKKKEQFGIEYRIKQENYQYLVNTVFGKRILVTDQAGWSDKEIIEAYYGQSRIERVFRHLKNPHYHAIRPQYHWTDQKIKVHAFCCLLGFLLSQLLHKKVLEAGFKLSLEEMLERLSKVRKGRIVYLTGAKGKANVEEYIEEADSLTEKLFKTVNN